MKNGVLSYYENEKVIKLSCDSCSGVTVDCIHATQFTYKHLTNDAYNFQTSECRDSIDRREMLSVAVSADEKMPFAFELSTTHHQSRVYLLAAETEVERTAWMIKMAAVSFRRSNDPFCVVS
jgi:hypothetical protein